MKTKLPSEEVREIWQEMKELKRCNEDSSPLSTKGEQLRDKFENIEILFGHESTLEKAIIYFLDERFKKQQTLIQNSYVNSESLPETPKEAKRRAEAAQENRI